MSLICLPARGHWDWKHSAAARRVRRSSRNIFPRRGSWKRISQRWESKQCSNLLMTSAFLWGKRDLPNQESLPRERPWLILCSPPYAFFVDRPDEMLGLISRLLEQAPVGSILIVEADERFDFDLLPGGSANRKARPRLGCTNLSAGGRRSMENVTATA